MQRFYKVSNNLLADSDAFVDTPVGDEVRAFYLPVFTADHPAAALRAARELLLATGHGDAGGPWIPVGAGIHTGQAYVGTVGVEGTNEYDVTVLGDVANVTGRLASLARQGEILVSEDAYIAAEIDLGDPERRTIELRGRTAPLDARVIAVAPVTV